MIITMILMTNLYFEKTIPYRHFHLAESFTGYKYIYMDYNHVKNRNFKFLEN